MSGLGRALLDLPGNVLVRGGGDEHYADGDDGSWRAVDWPALTRTLRVAERDVNVVDSGGDGPPILFVHGLGGHWQNWLATLPAFIGAHRVIAPDLPGFGRSPMPAGRISIPGYTRVLAQLCDALAVTAPIVVGNSMGGLIAADLAIAHPELVRRLVLVDAAGLSIEGLWKEPLLTLARLLRLSSHGAAAAASPLLRRPRLRRAVLQPFVRYPERLSGRLAGELIAGGEAPGLVGGLDAVLSYPIRDRVAAIVAPTLIVWGRNDVLVPVADAAELERLIGANARSLVFEDTGHLPMLERPSAFNALLADFIAEG